ncbi:MAG: cation transporter [Acetobacteraceae bacterium]|nr:cation transporter [Acetobacteraceae bacterium]
MEKSLVRAEWVAVGSIGIGCLVLALKGAAWWLTGSAALYSDALESTVNVAASIIAYVAFRLATKPADAGHPYGHEKAEFFAAVIEGVMIVIAALSIFQESWESWRNPHPLNAPLKGIGMNAAATVLNGLWAALLMRTGRQVRSAALVADGRHLLSDVVTSIGVVLGVAATIATGILKLDPIIAALAGVYVLWSGLSVISSSVGGLMDAAPDDEVVGRIRALVGQSAEGAIEAHDLRMRRAGRLTFLEFHLVVPGDMTVAAAHDICDRVEAALKSEIQGLMITIHVEPEGKAKHHGVVVL